MSELSAKDLIEARKNLNLLAAQTRGLLALDAFLAEAGDIDKLIAARKSELVGVEDELALVLGDVADAKTALAGVQAEIDAARNDVSAAAHEAAAIIERARQDAENIAAQAQAAAAATAEAARLEADKLRADAKLYAEKLREELGTCRDLVSDYNLQAADAEARRDAALAEIERLKAVFGGP